MRFTSAVSFLHLLLLIGCCNGAGNEVKMVVVSRNQHKAEQEGGYACYVNEANDVEVQSVKPVFGNEHLQNASQPKSDGIWEVDVKDSLNNTKNDTFGVFGCSVGKNETYISTVRIQSDALIVPRDGLYTKTVSLMDRGVTIAMNISGELADVRWRNNSRFWNTCENNSPNCMNVKVDTFSISGAIQPYHSGVYECHFNGKRRNAQHGIVILIVRACPSSKWGYPNCTKQCKNCLNGGHCNEYTGECICPPGFKGENCSEACGGNRFGYECEKMCNPTIDCPDKCGGYLFCLNHPFGCRCGTGWMGLDCDIPCSEGTYGASCLQTCNCTNGQSCNRYTGECSEDADSTEHGKACGECNCQEDGTCTNIKEDLTCNNGCTRPWFTDNCDIGIKNVSVRKVNPGLKTDVSCILSEAALLTVPYNVTLSRNKSSVDDSNILKTGETTFSVLTTSETDYTFCQVWQGNIITAWHIKELPVYKLPTLSQPPRKWRRTETSITIRWDPWGHHEDDDGDGPVIAYIPYYKNESADKWIQGFEVLPEEWLQFTASELVNDTVYEFRVAAVREGVNGEGPMGPAILIKPGWELPLYIIIIAGSFLFILLLLVTAVFVGCYRRRRHSRRSNSMTKNGAYSGFADGKVFNEYSERRNSFTHDSRKQDLNLSQITKEADFEDDEDDFSDDDYFIPQDYSQVEKPQPIKIEEFYGYMIENEHSLEAEFRLFKKGKQHPWTVGEREENREKNRFRDLYPYDHSRVKLKKHLNDYYSDYYNASFILNQVGEIAFIAAQGPNRASLNDFWRMIWEQKVSTVAMVTNLFKGSKRRCSQYWPDREGSQKTFGKIQVEWTATDFHSDYIIRSLNISQDGEHREVLQLHFLTWPDLDVPQHHNPFTEFVNRTRQVHAAIETPLVVHCSAGIGKTGTFIALYCMMDVLQNDIYIDIFNFVEEMRERRINMIQSPNEYIFLHKCLLEYHLTRHTEMDGEVLARIDVELKGNILSEEFELMKYFKEMAVHQTSKGSSYQNSAKNRFPDILPVDENIPTLLVDNLSREDAYINATLVNSFRGRNSFILTQSPLPNTMEDFWRMVYDQKCPCIVMLNQLDPNDMKCPEYWPESGTRMFGKIAVTCTSEEDRTTHIYRVFEVTHLDFQKIHEVHHLQMLSWPPEMSYLGVLQLVAEMEMLLDEFTGTAPTVVHCIDGVGRCGVFVAVKSEVERLANTRKLNLFSTMKQLRSRNPHILAKWKDYFLCYQILGCFVQEMYSYDAL